MNIIFTFKTLLTCPYYRKAFDERSSYSDNGRNARNLEETYHEHTQQIWKFWLVFSNFSCKNIFSTGQSPVLPM